MPTWTIRDVDDDTRAQIKAFAAKRKLKLGKALKHLIDQLDPPNNKSTP